MDIRDAEYIIWQSSEYKTLDPLDMDIDELADNIYHKYGYLVAAFREEDKIYFNL